MRTLKEQETYAIMLCDTEALKEVMAKKYTPSIRLDLYEDLAFAIGKSQFKDIGFIEYIQSLPGFNGWDFLKKNKTLTAYEEIVLASLNDKAYFDYVQQQEYFPRAMDLIVSRNILKNYSTVPEVLTVFCDNNWIKLDATLFCKDTFTIRQHHHLNFALNENRLEMNEQEIIQFYQDLWHKMLWASLELLCEKKPFLYDLTLSELLMPEEKPDAYKQMSNVMPKRFEMLLTHHQSDIEDLINLTSGWFQSLSQVQHENYMLLFKYLQTNHASDMPYYLESVEKNLKLAQENEDENNPQHLHEFKDLFDKYKLYYTIHDKIEQQDNLSDDEDIAPPKMKI
jgi:hypothetical protein